MPQIIDFSALFVKLDDIISEAVFSLTETIKGKDATGLSDMREQILANAKTMWPMTQVFAKSPRIEALPDFDVILMGHGETFWAAVVYEAINDAEKFLYIKGDTGETAEEAMHMLLETAMAMMSLLYRDFVVEGVEGGGGGHANGGRWFAPGY